ncbi:MAG: hypothetical protein L0271_06345 [Gemmatimonadetes bacterium]|nr:hypothetical protein [Gemmatimonadota bacterium]
MTWLASEILRLSDRERTVLTLYYYRDLEPYQIGAVLGLTESSISKIRTRALTQLRTRMARLRTDA